MARRRPSAFPEEDFLGVPDGSRSAARKTSQF